MRAGEALGQLGNMLGSLVGSIASFGSALRNIFNPDISGWEKFLAVLSAVSSGLILLGRTITSAVKVIEWLNNAEKIAIVTKSLNAAASFL
jgi:hypothetical protein